ncbi:MAG TPA: patatin, partial [Brevundimonas sp.]
NPAPHRARSALYVVVNGQVGRNTGVTPGRIDGIPARTYDSMSKASLRLSLAATAAFASRNGMTVEMSAIPDNVTVSSLKFDTATMQALFEMGRTRSASGEAWASVTPSGRPGPLVAIQNAPAEQIPEALATPPTAAEAPANTEDAPKP